jgi:hypothetical protein
MHTFAAALTNAAYLTSLHDRYVEIAAWAPSRRRDALVDQFAAEIERMTDAQDQLADMDQFAAEGEAEISEELDAAISETQAIGTLIVRDAAALGAQMQRACPGCCVQRGAVKVWSVVLERGELRLTLKSGALKGVMSWRAA